MRKIFYFISVLLLLVSCGSDKTGSFSTDPLKVSNLRGVTTQSVLSNIEKGRYREGEVLVKFKTGTVSSSRTHQSIGATVLRKSSAVQNLEHVKLPVGLSVRDAVIKYMNDPSVEYAEPNYERRASTTIPNDLFFDQQWALRNTGQTVNGIVGIPNADIEATDAWDLNRGSSGVIVAVIDSGIDFTHPDLAANVIGGASFVSPSPMDDFGHGTQMAGIIGAVGNNGTGITGLMWRVSLMPLKFLDATGSGVVSDEIAAIDFAVKNGALVINASFAGADFSQAEYDEINLANSLGVLLVAAAGNGGGPFCDNGAGQNNDALPCYPASYVNPNDINLVVNNLGALPNIISVSATDQSDNLASFSNFGPNSIDVAAPGNNILSTFPVALTPSNQEPYVFDSGTSHAAAYVSGLAGLIYSQNPNLSHFQVRSIILNNVEGLSSLNNLIFTSGRINAFLALNTPIGPSISVSPASKDFGDTNIGSVSTAQTFTISNTGTANLAISPITLTGANAFEFAMTSDGCSGQTIAPLFSCTIQVVFSPTSTGGKSANIAIPSNDPVTSVVAVSLTGTGTVPPSGGGGCSIGARQNMPTAAADGALLLVPPTIIILSRRRRAKKNS